MRHVSGYASLVEPIVQHGVENGSRQAPSSSWWAPRPRSQLLQSMRSWKQLEGHYHCPSYPRQHGLKSNTCRLGGAVPWLVGRRRCASSSPGSRSVRRTLLVSPRCFLAGGRRVYGPLSMDPHSAVHLRIGSLSLPRWERDALRSRSERDGSPHLHAARNNPRSYQSSAVTLCVWTCRRRGPPPPSSPALSSTSCLLQLAATGGMEPTRCQAWAPRRRRSSRGALLPWLGSVCSPRSCIGCGREKSRRRWISCCGNRSTTNSSQSLPQARPQLPCLHSC
mmetsp:Transcript_10502/g.33357  ORF Transcript_10502/g.33357 Transcript_10502/m.33357 type:complete len:279 (+) Transcript_10502:223-1059(+)